MQYEHSIASIHRIKKNVHKCVIASRICERALSWKWGIIQLKFTNQCSKINKVFLLYIQTVFQIS